MKKNLLLAASLALTLLLAVSSCGKKEASAPAPDPVAAAPATAAPAGAAPVAPTQTAVLPDARLAESQAALKARDYDKAAAALIAVQRAKLNDQQAAAAAAQMRQLQSSLAEAVASGDPRAKAAADRLRQSAMSR